MKSHLLLFLAPILAAAAGVACAPEKAPPTEGQAAVAGVVPVAPRAERRKLYRKGLLAMNQRQFAACGDFFGAAGEAFNAASCQARGGNEEVAFAYLARAIDGNLRSLKRFDDDSGVGSLRGDPRWAAERSRLAAKIADEERRSNAELVQLHEEDQADRQGDFRKIDMAQVGPRDQRRRERVEAILAAGGAHTSADYFRAAMVFHHTEGGSRRAHELALEAVDLDPDNEVARWLAAAAEDRWLISENKPQKWGTQPQQVGGKWQLGEVDPAITDEQRAEWNVPPLAQSQADANQMNKQEQPSR